MSETINPGDLALVLVAVGFALLLRFLLAVRRLWDGLGPERRLTFAQVARASFTKGAFGPQDEWARGRASASAALGAVLVLSGLGVAIFA